MSEDFSSQPDDPIISSNQSPHGSDATEFKCCDEHKKLGDMLAEKEKRVHAMLLSLQEAGTSSHSTMIDIRSKLQKIISESLKRVENSFEPVAYSHTPSVVQIDPTILEEVDEYPRVQFASNGAKLDVIYLGSDPAAYGRALRVQIFGNDGLAYKMLLPNMFNKNDRGPLSTEKVLKFFRAVQRKFPREKFPNAMAKAKKAANKAGHSARQRIEKKGKNCVRPKKSNNAWDN